jgi:tRNA threonylcarbamoyladenosine biosynthesis protein TsaE
VKTLRVLKNRSLEQMPELADFLYELQKSYNILSFVGNLGAGKTTVIKLLAEKMGLKDKVQSPTFGYVNVYDKVVYHFDCYRIESLEEALDHGFEEYFEDENMKIWIEWPQSVEELLPRPYVQVQIQHAENSRNITINLIA